MCRCLLCVLLVTVNSDSQTSRFVNPWQANRGLSVANKENESDENQNSTDTEA